MENQLLQSLASLSLVLKKLCKGICFDKLLKQQPNTAQMQVVATLEYAQSDYWNTALLAAS